MKQFNNTAILTSKNPEAFLNFTYDGSDFWIIPDCCIGPNILYVNGLDVNDYMGTPSLGYALFLDATNNIASFQVHTPINYKFDTNLRFHFYDVSTFTSTPDISVYDVSVWNRPYIVAEGGINAYTNEDILVDDEASYLLLRTNPKFTGNIKLYIDTSNNLYLDTFKISDILSNRTYRHQQQSANSILSSDIRNVFSSLPLGELYRVDVNNTLEIGVPKTDLKNQYNTTYNYGATLLKDELYPEDNGILAPLWINSKLPDYFAIFRLNGVYNQETYDGSSLTDLAFKYLEESDLIRSWSIKPEAPLGQYLHTHLADVVKIQAPVFLSLTDPNANQSDPNTWYGVAVDKGVITGRSETTYYFNQKANNFTDLNAFMSQGFERNTLLCPNIVNMEFIFSDNDVSEYTMSRYFGIYLTENILYQVAYYSDSSSGPVEIISLDGKDSSVFMNSSLFFDTSGNVVHEYANRILVLNDEVQLQRIANVSQINDTIINSYLSKPYKNLFSTEVQEIDTNPFITLTLNNTLEQGEHLRIINKTQGKIWEIYSSDLSTYDCLRYCTISQDPSHLTVYRTIFDINGDIAYQIEEIKDAFNRFSDYEGTQFKCGVYGDNWVSIILNDNALTIEEWAFQRIAAPTLNDFSDPSSGFNTAASPSDIIFFGRFTPSSSDFDTIAIDASFGPIDFELYGARQSIIVDFFNPQTNYLYSFNSSQNILDKFEVPTLYQGYDLWYRRILDFDVSNNSYQYVKDPTNIGDKVLIMTSNRIQIVNTRFNAYSIYPLNISLMGINPVKDIDYTVYDYNALGERSEYFYNRECDISTWYFPVDACSNGVLDIPGSYVIQSGTGMLRSTEKIVFYTAGTIFNTFDVSVDIQANEATLATYAVLDGSYNYVGYSGTYNEENVSTYYDSSTLLKYGLTVPLVSKWVGLGNDCRNNPVRLILDGSMLSTGLTSNFIPTATEFSQEISYPSFKYLSTCGRAWEDYVFYDINDVLRDTDTSSYMTFKQLMFQYPYVDYFSKLVYSNYNVDAIKTRSSIVYYNGYKNTIDTIFLGLNLSIKVENIAKNILDIKNYDRYRFSFISTPSKNKDNKRPIEVIINENTKTILMIWYQGNDELNYNVRYSSFLPGKALFDSSNNGFVSGIDQSTYSFVKTPYIVKNSTIQKNLVNLYGTSTTYDSSSCRPYAQLNKNENTFNSIWNAFGENTLTAFGIFNPEGNKYYDTFAQYVSYPYIPNINTFGDYVINYGYNYNTNRNWYTANTTNYSSLLYYLSSARSYVMYYVLRGDSVYNSYDFGSTPLTVTINSPRSYLGLSTYGGWFKPKFNSILEFKSDEDSEFIDLVDRDFIFSNTNLRLYNSIPQLWYNKVVTTVTPADISAGNAISYFSDYNVFKSLWDADYYMKDSAYIDGYESPDELSSFFGSKLPKLPDALTLENWDITTASSVQTSSEITLSFNLTRAIVNKFKSNAAFINNWGGLTSADNVIDSYIKNTIVTYYNISQSKLLVNFYYKSYSNQLLYYTYDVNFINDNKQNFNGQLVYENDEYIYKMIIPKAGNFSYFVSFTMTEK